MPDGLQPDLEEHTVEIEAAGSRLLGDRRRVFTVVAAFVLLIVGIYVLLPKVVGLHDALRRLSDPNWAWIAVAVLFNGLSFLAYAMLFRGILGGPDEDHRTYKRLDFSASFAITTAGAGGVALTYWALRKAGMERRRAACRMVAFLVLLYSVYAGALIVFAVLLRTGVLSGEAPVAGTIVPAGLAASAFGLAALIALIPDDLERRITDLESRRRTSKLAQRLATGPAIVASGVRTAIDNLRHPRRGARAVGGALGYWASMIGILWACFHAFGGGVPLGVVVQGFFVGMAANLAPSPAAGVGTLDAGMIGAFLLFGIPSDTVFPAVLAFRIVGFWLPIVPGVIAYVQLRRQVNGWQDEDDRESYTIKSKVTAEAN